MIAIDTLKLSEDLKEGGFDDRQTASLVDLGRTLSDQALEKLATKDDLHALEERVDNKFELMRKDMTTEIDSLRKDTKAEIDGLRKDMTANQNVMMAEMVGMGKDLKIWFGSLMIAGIGILVLLDRLFPVVASGSAP